MNKNKFLGLTGLVSAAFIGGAVMPSVIRLGTSLMHPFLLNWLRVFLGLIVILIFFRKKYRAKLVFTKKNILFSLVLGIGLGLNVTMFSFGIQQTTLVASQLIYTLTPIVTGFLAYLLLKERVTLKKIGGMVLALTGVLILIFFSQSPDKSMSLGTLYGNLLLFIGMFGYSSYLVFSRKLTAVFSIIEMVLLTNLSLSIILLPLAIYGVYQQGIAQVNLRSLAAIILIMVSALIFMALSQLAIKHLSAGTASLGSLLSPEFAAFAGIAIYHEELSLILLISMILSIGGVFISITAEKTTFLDKIRITINKLRPDR
jgi:drug/metabolite transporter (DMT)-like permease